MTPGACETKYSNCACCGQRNVTDECICLWCYRNYRRCALFCLIPEMQKWLGNEAGFCLCCKKYIVDKDLIDRFLVSVWCKGVSDDEYKTKSEHQIAECYASHERKALMYTRCRGGNMEDAYLKYTLDDMQKKESDEVIKELDELYDAAYGGD